MPAPLSLSAKFQLDPWQTEALSAWARSEHPTLGRRHGIFDIFTGAGKTVLALAAMVDAAAEVPDLQFAIVVPTAALVSQWAQMIPRVLDGADATSVGRCGNGRHDSFATHRFVVYVINSAREHLVHHVRGRRVMLVVDECHRAGSEKNQAIFGAATRFRLGLSATAHRNELDEEGNPLALELQTHGKALGPVCYRLTFKDARQRGLLPPYQIHHHSLALSTVESAEYASLSHDCSEAEKAFAATGPHSSYLNYVRNRIRGATAAQKQRASDLQNAYLGRKQWLYRVAERNRVARSVLARVARRATQAGRTIRAMLFNELVGDDESAAPRRAGESPEAAREDGATALFAALRLDVASGALDLGGLDESAVALEHSRLDSRTRMGALDGFRDGSVRVLVSVKALTEGIDVPDADLGLSVASTSSARQRIQTMGRLLRYPRGSDGKRLPAAVVERLPPKELHLLYVGGTVDERIYRDQDWTDETGPECNFYWRWAWHAEAPLTDEDPPRPPLTEAEAWAAIASLPMPQPWRGSTLGDRWSYRQDTITRPEEGAAALDPRAAVAMLRSVAARVGRDIRGGFTVTPELHVLLKAGTDPRSGDSVVWACGRLAEALVARDAPTASDSRVGVSTIDVAAPARAITVAAPRARSDDAPASSFAGDTWFDVLKRAFLAAVDSDLPRLRSCRALLDKRDKGREHGIPLLDLLEARSPSPVESSFDARTAAVADLFAAGVRAFAARQVDILRRCREELGRRGQSTGKPKVIDMATALAILLGETRTVRLDGGR